MTKFLYLTSVEIGQPAAMHGLDEFSLHTRTILIDTTNLVDGVGKPNTGKDVTTSKVHYMIRIANRSNKPRSTFALQAAVGKPLHSSFVRF